MPGIEDVQPKQISSLGQPIVPTIEPVVTQDAMKKLTDAFRQGFITTNDILDRAREQDKQNLLLQRAKEEVSPEAVAARKAANELTTEKALGERETMLSKDFVAAYLRYNLPLKKSDGTPDYTGMAEVGQKYADYERLLKYSEMGVTPAGQPVTWTDEKGIKHVQVFNAFGEDITQVPGKVNKVLEEHQKNLRKARSFILQNDKEPEVPEGEEPPQIDVSSKQAAPVAITPAPVVSAPAPVRTVGAPPVEIAPKIPSAVGPLTDWTQQVPVIHGGPAPSIIVPQQPTVAVAPTAPPVAAAPPVIQPPEATLFYTPGEGRTMGSEFKPDEYMKDVRSSELYKNWAEKTPAISGFRATARAYQSKPEGSITTQDDIDLANAALQIASPGSTAGGRGMEAYRITRIEDSIPLLERLLDLPDVVLKRNKFPKGTRDRIIAITERKAEEIERLGRDTIQSAQERLKTQGLNPAVFLFEPEKQLVKGPAGASQAVGGTITLPSGRQLIWSQ